MKPRAVHTVESLLARAEEVGECRVWTGYSVNRTPQVESNGKMVPVRRLLSELAGKDASQGRIFGVNCGTLLCVCPAHTVQRTMKSHAKVMAKAKNRDKAAQSKQQIVARRKRSDIKLSEEKAREIRESVESGPVLALRYGVSKSLINRVKRGICWPDQSNPFLGLLAA